MEELRYDANSIKRFEQYFTTSPVPRKPRKRGRPKKKGKRGRPRKKLAVKTCKQTIMTQDPENPTVIDLTLKHGEDFEAQLEGVLAKCKRSSGKKRTNWDTPANSAYRKRVADSWTGKCDLYTKGDNFGRFCVKMGIHRHVLKRYLEGKYAKGQTSKQASRGRPTLLKESVMRHLCEGWSHA